MLSGATCETRVLIETPVIALHLDVGVDVKSDRIKFLTGFSLVEREL